MFWLTLGSVRVEELVTLATLQMIVVVPAVLSVRRMEERKRATFTPWIDLTVSQSIFACCITTSLMVEFGFDNCN